MRSFVCCQTRRIECFQIDLILPMLGSSEVLWNDAIVRNGHSFFLLVIQFPHKTEKIKKYEKKNTLKNIEVALPTRSTCFVYIRFFLCPSSIYTFFFSFFASFCRLNSFSFVVSLATMTIVTKVLINENVYCLFDSWSLCLRFNDVIFFFFFHYSVYLIRMSLVKIFNSTANKYKKWTEIIRNYTNSVRVSMV